MNMNEKINSFSFSTIILSLASASFYGIISSYIIYKTKESSLISIIIGFIISLFIIKIILSFFKNNESLNYTNKIKKTFPKLHFIFNSLSILVSIFSYILLTYRLTTFLSSNYLTSTSKWLISLLIIFLTYYMSSKGFNTIIRLSLITFYITIINFLFDLFNLINQISIDNLLPVISVSYKQIIISSIVFALYFSLPVILINTVSYNTIIDKEKLSKYSYLMLSLSFIIIFLSAFITIGVNGSTISGLFDYPVYSTLKRIKLFNKIDSLENISISSWFLFIINSCNVMLYHSFSSIKDTFNINNNIYKYICLLLAFIVPNFIFQKNNYNETYSFIFIPIITSSIPFLIMIIYKIKKLLIK